MHPTLKALVFDLRWAGEGLAFVHFLLLVSLEATSSSAQYLLLAVHLAAVGAIWDSDIQPRSAFCKAKTLPTSYGTRKNFGFLLLRSSFLTSAPRLKS